MNVLGIDANDLTEKQDITILPAFENFGVAVACSDKMASFLQTHLKLKSLSFSIELMKDSLSPILDPFLNMPNLDLEIKEISSIEMSNGVASLVTPQVGAIPKCLDDKSVQDFVLKTQSFVNDLLTPGIQEIQDFTTKVTDNINYLNERRKDFTSDINAQIKAANNLINDTSTMIMDSLYLPLFLALDGMKEFLIKTNFINIYKYWLDYRKCLETNCAILKPKLPNDNFLYYTEEKKQSLIPIDYSTGVLRVSKFYEEMNPKQLQNAEKIDDSYNKYLLEKQKIAKQAQQIASNLGVPDDINPFNSSANTPYSTDNLVNTLF